MTYPSHFVFGGGAGVDEGLSDDGEHGVDAVGHLNVQNELRVLQDVDPEPQRETGDIELERVVGDSEIRDMHPGVLASPVGLPDVDGLRVVYSVFLRHVVQEVEEKPDCDGRRTLGAEDGHEDIVHELLQRPLQRHRQVTSCSGRPHLSLCLCGVCYLHGQQSGQVDLRYGLGSLPFPHAALPMFRNLRIFAALHQVPQTQTLLFLPFQHRCF